MRFSAARLDVQLGASQLDTAQLDVPPDVQLDVQLDAQLDASQPDASQLDVPPAD